MIEAGSKELVVAYPDEPVFYALYRMLQNNIGRLPVVSRGDPRVLLGYLSRGSVLGAWTRQFEEEFQREHGWLKQLLGAGSDKTA